MLESLLCNILGFLRRRTSVRAMKTALKVMSSFNLNVSQHVKRWYQGLYSKIKLL